MVAFPYCASVRQTSNRRQSFNRSKSLKGTWARSTVSILDGATSTIWAKLAFRIKGETF
jgi:hypothetical protein